jgi:DNA replication protein DnaC
MNPKMKNDDPSATIRKHLHTLKLFHMLGALDEQMALATKEGLPPSQFLENLLTIECDQLVQRRIERRIRDSKLPERKLLVDFDFEFQAGLDKAQIMELATLSFVERKEGVILAGKSGTGKSHIAQALLLLGCQKLYRCRYATAAQMLKDLMSGSPGRKSRRKAQGIHRATDPSH